MGASSEGKVSYFSQNMQCFSGGLSHSRCSGNLGAMKQQHVRIPAMGFGVRDELEAGRTGGSNSPAFMNSPHVGHSGPQDQCHTGKKEMGRCKLDSNWQSFQGGHNGSFRGLRLACACRRNPAGLSRTAELLSTGPL